MAKRIASRAEARNTSSSTRPRKKYLITLRSKLMGLRIAGMARRRDRGTLDRRRLLSFLAHNRKSLVFTRRIGNYHAHKIQPDRQCSVAAGFIFSQIPFFVEAHPHAASQAGRKAHKPRISVIIGGSGLAGNGMVQF